MDRLGCPTSSNLKEMALEEMNVCNFVVTIIGVYSYVVF